MKLLIIGATGATGREIISQALTQGHAVTALVRDSGKANFAQHVEKAVGNVLEPGTLEKVLTGQEAVICSLGSAATGPFKEMTMLSQGTRNLVAAMKSQRVNRLICITGIGAGDSEGHGPWYYNWLIQPLMLRGVYKDKTRQEEIVRGSGLAWTLVRPAMGEVLGRKIKAASLSREKLAEISKGRGSKKEASPMKAMFDWYDAHGMVGNPLILRAILGREPRTLRAYFEELAAKPRSSRSAR